MYSETENLLACWRPMGCVVPPPMGQPKPCDSSQGPPGMAHRGRVTNCNIDYIPVANINVVQLQPCAMSSRRGRPDKINGVPCFEWIEEHPNHPKFTAAAAKKHPNLVGDPPAGHGAAAADPTCIPHPSTQPRFAGASSRSCNWGLYGSVQSSVLHGGRSKYAIV